MAEIEMVEHPASPSDDADPASTFRATSAPHVSFRRCVEELLDPVARVLRRCGVLASEEEDAMQTLLLRLYRHWSELESLSMRDLRSYACCVAVHVAKDANRARVRQRAR